MKRSTVLLAGGDASRRTALRVELKKNREFIVVGEAENGQDALDLVRLKRPQLLAINAALPVMDGVSVLREIKEQKLKKPYIIMVAQYVSGYYRQTAQELGAEVCLQHPISEKPMIGHMRALLRAALSVPMPAKIETRIGEILTEIGVQPHFKGSQYLRTAIALTAKEPSIVGEITKILYPNVADIHATSASRVECAIRHAIKSAWGAADPALLERYFGNIDNYAKGRPTNSKFISTIADRVRAEKRTLEGQEREKEKARQRRKAERLAAKEAKRREEVEQAKQTQQITPDLQ